ncbi:MAG TPA: hypothetical protein VHT24_06265 [Pseudacidobacterium sp.]|nr:hypothetical protein [Pseudacidobacterium sp.]
MRETSSGVVLWLNPITDPPAKVTPGHFRLMQKDKSFSPHLLVVPLGSSVDFPNMDPFYHNVFSQFDGKRFDLGLYEAGSVKTVRFDHEGISYIFCNIHPQMSAVVIALATPYVAGSSDSGKILLPNVSVGTYELHLWAEGVDTQQLNALSRRVQVGLPETSLGIITLTKADTIPPHKNKFGEDYKPDASTEYGPNVP